MAATPIIVNTPSNKGVLDKLIAAGLIVGGVWYGNKLYKDWRAKREGDKAGGDPNIQAATEIHQAIDGSGTSEKVLFSLATNIKDWKEVSKAYRKLYPGKDMLTDIKGDLDPADYKKFMNIYNLSQTDKTGKPVTGKNLIEKGLWVLLEKDTNIRKTPRVIGKWEETKNRLKNTANLNTKSGNNIITLGKQNKYIGVTTGRQSIDTDSTDGTLFLEVMMAMLDKKLKHTLVPVWVASSQVKTEKKINFKPASNQLAIISDSEYNFALSGLLGLGDGIGENTNYRSELILNVPFAAILDVKENVTGQATGKGLILGFKDSEYANKLGERFFIFRNIQGLIRMVSVNQVREEKV